MTTWQLVALILGGLLAFALGLVLVLLCFIQAAGRLIESVLKGLRR